MESTLRASEAARKSVNAAVAGFTAGFTAGLDHEAPIESVSEKEEWCGSGFDGKGGR